MSDVDQELDNQENEDLELENQEQEDLQEDADLEQDEQDEQEQQEDEDESDDSDQDEEEEKPKPSRREQLRIQQLLGKIKEEQPSPKKVQQQDKTVFDDESEDDKLSQTVEALYRFNKFETRLEVDAPRVAGKYKHLDKESDEFNPVLADTINRMYLGFVGFDAKNRSVRTADIRYSDYVESVYELASEIAGETVERTTTNLKKQASKTGVRPGGGSTKRLNLNKAPSDMTDEELELAIKSSMPKR